MNILVISPHPDDEAIGCGGTICSHVSNGDQVFVLFLTSGEKGGHGRTEQETMALREMEASGAGKILGIAGLEFWREPDGSFSAQKNLERFERKITEWDPMIIYAPHEFESHPDHKQAFKMVRDYSGKYQSTYKGDLLFYEVWTPIRDMDHIVDISEFIESKKAAILAHKSQCDVLRFDEAILGLNRYRGEMHSWPGGDYAEVFTRLKTRT